MQGRAETPIHKSSKFLRTFVCCAFHKPHSFSCSYSPVGGRLQKQVVVRKARRQWTMGLNRLSRGYDELSFTTLMIESPTLFPWSYHKPTALLLQKRTAA